MIQMHQSNNNDRISRALATSSNKPKCISGFSTATATTTGITVLVWAKKSALPRAQATNRYKVASDIYPSRNGSYGWGQYKGLAISQECKVIA
jgi:serine protease